MDTRWGRLHTGATQPAGMRTYRSNHLRTLTTAALVAVLAAGCSTDSAVSSERGKEAAVDSATPAPTASTTAAPQEMCFNPEGGECLGDLKPGTYRTTLFQPGLRYTVGRGWV